MTEQIGFRIKWFNRGTQARYQADPAYPNGFDLDASQNRRPFCVASLSYPVKTMGYYEVTCWECGQNCRVTMAGRVDDPRSVKLGCKKR